jgi:hypothetical protein
MLRALSPLPSPRGDQQACSWHGTVADGLIGLVSNSTGALGVRSPQVAEPPPQISSDERSCTGSKRRIKRVNEVGLQANLLVPGRRPHQGSHRCLRHLAPKLDAASHPDARRLSIAKKSKALRRTPLELSFKTTTALTSSSPRSDDIATMADFRITG